MHAWPSSSSPPGQSINPSQRTWSSMHRYRPIRSGVGQAKRSIPSSAGGHSVIKQHLFINMVLNLVALIATWQMSKRQQVLTFLHNQTLYFTDGTITSKIKLFFTILEPLYIKISRLVSCFIFATGIYHQQVLHRSIMPRHFWNGRRKP